MTDNQLISLPDDNEVDLTTVQTDAYLGRIKLTQMQSQEVGEGKVAKGGNFLYETDSGCVDLGNCVQLLNCRGRVKAIDYSGEEVIVSYKAESPEFQRIAANCRYGSNRMAGPEFLVYVPQVQAFAYLFAYNKTLKGISAELQANKGKAIELESYFYKGNRDSWFKVKVNQTSPFDIPSMDDINAAIDKFKKEETEEGEAAPEDKRAR